MCNLQASQIFSGSLSSRSIHSLFLIIALFWIIFFIFNGLLLIWLCFLFICVSHCFLPVFISLFYWQSGSMITQTQLSELHSIELKPDKRHFWLFCHCCARLKVKPTPPPSVYYPQESHLTRVFTFKQTHAAQGTRPSVRCWAFFYFAHASMHPCMHELTLSRTDQQECEAKWWRCVSHRWTSSVLWYV